MVCLNTFIPFDKLKLKKSIKQELVDDINNNFYLNDGFGLEKIESNIKLELTESIIKNVNKLIIEKINNLFSSDHFIYKHMDNNFCTHKFKKGKLDGFFCCKKITSNGDANKYVCTKHNKNHIPKKKLKKINNVNKVNMEKTEKGIDKQIFLQNDYINRFNNKKIFKKKQKSKRKKIIVAGVIDFKYILKKLLI
jgi:translation elongation factor EF-1beta